ncbi:hypothetical protein SYNPS1DRAFT_26575 [Syncephalis pseudoplumigaleata]|uniref:FAD/NAD(P)-binding domain-containing protein n=1 Tax=Syncephalis pseudoplumigaleata TaxID=1712513 RepID=A0A4P9Z5A8_9FUNG|nr:hypothetical protein SYNPS1DRAFT_26575 [Syncephalis pseudoplumigaleata]|eukprot:RKP27793.1 hypothetical protein SYNPS1DRAFT_26575 [Syncephalis pseudoplumigaleata]
MVRAQQQQQQQGEAAAWYEGLPDARVLRFRPGNYVDIGLADGRVVTRAIAGAMVVIGRQTRPQFPRGSLALSNLLGTQGEDGSMAVAYGQPVRIDPWTSQVADEQCAAPYPGLYAIGAMTGDTTVRFSLGAPLGALLHLTAADVAASSSH